jgi:GxxExxY protein
LPSRSPEREGFACQRQVPLPVSFRGKRLDADFRIDLIVSSQVLVELKSIEAFTKLHEAQMLTYLRLAERRLDFLINFNVPTIKQGIRCFAR